jgi:uroporphyrinogen-III synthase
VPDADGPLAGWRVLITRPAEQAAPFAAALAAAGAVALRFPTITLAPPPSWQPLDDALARIADYAWAVFTSPSAVAFTLGRAADTGLSPSALAGLRLAAVGSETARALTARGLSVEVVPAADDQRQEGLIEELLARIGQTPAPGHAVATGRILFPQAIGGRELLRDELSRRGHAVDVVPVSQTIARDLSDAGTDVPPDFDVATFASPSALRAFVRGLGVDRLAAAVIAVIGPTTAEAAAALGVRVDVMPPTPSVSALVAALIRHRGQRI